MWAICIDDTCRHDYGGQDPPLAICGYKGVGKIDYNAVTIPKCQACLALWLSYGKERGKME